VSIRLPPTIPAVGMQQEPMEGGSRVAIPRKSISRCRLDVGTIRRSGLDQEDDVSSREFFLEKKREKTQESNRLSPSDNDYLIDIIL
jgi:hypothetical protein